MQLFGTCELRCFDFRDQSALVSGRKKNGKVQYFGDILLYLNDFVLPAKIFNNFSKLPYKNDSFPNIVFFDDFGIGTCELRCFIFYDQSALVSVGEKPEKYSILVTLCCISAIVYCQRRYLKGFSNLTMTIPFQMCFPRDREYHTVEVQNYPLSILNRPCKSVFQNHQKCSNPD